MPLEGADACEETAAATVFRSTGGATFWLLDHGTMIGWRTFGPARSPSTTTAPTGQPRLRASSLAPAPPSVPLIDARTIE